MVALSTSTAPGATLDRFARSTKRFGSRTALAPISFELEPGQLVGIIGPNGAGKTTLLSILAGVSGRRAGEVLQPAGKIGWVPQQPALYSKLSVAENLRLFARLEKVDDPEATVLRMLRQTDLEDRADDEVGKLSGGNQQRVNIAIGLLCAPAVLLLDEPSASLDPRQRERLVGVHRWPGGGRHDRRVLDPQRGRGRALRRPAAGPGRRRAAVHGHARPSSSRRWAAQSRDFEAAFVRFLHERGH